MLTIPFYRQFRFKLAAMYILLITAVIVLSGVFSYQAAEKQFRQLLYQEFQSTRNVTHNFLLFVEQTALMTAKSVARDEAMLRILSSNSSADLTVKLTELMEQNSSDIIILLNNKGRVLAQGHDPKATGNSLLAFDFVNDLRSGKQIVTAVVQDQNSFILYSAVAIEHPATSEPVYVLTGYALNNSFVDHIQENSHMDVSLVRERSIISTTLRENGERLTTLPLPFLEYQMLLATPDQVMEYHFQGKDYFLSTQRLPLMQDNMAGSILLAHSLEELKEVKKQLAVQFIFIFVSSLLVGMTIILFFTNRILQPIKQLIQSTQQISTGDLDCRVDLKSKDELGLLGKHFNQMTDAVQKSNHALKQYSQDLEQQVTERTNSLQNKTEQLQHYVTAIDDVGVGLCIINDDHTIQTMNNTLIGWFGDHCNSKCYHAIRNQENPCSYCKLRKGIEQQEIVHSQFSRFDGQTFEVVATQIYNNDGTVSILEMIRDITKQKKQEEYRLETSLQEERLNKLESLRTMAGAIAHRFNNSMMAVQGNLELMICTLPADSQEYEMASAATLAANDAAQVGSMMLSYLGQQPLNLQKISLETLVGNSVTSLKSLLTPSISILFSAPEQPLFIAVDQKQIKEVLVSILTNAIESLNDRSGTIEITFGSDYFTTDSFPLTFHNDHLKDGEYVYCQIKDFGHGINPQDLSRIFDPFYTTRFVGRGLGLALTVGFMQAHHGAIMVESIEGMGTTVRVLLPSISSTQPVTPSDDLQDDVVQFSGNILLADDEEMVLDVGRQMLEFLGFTVHTAMDGQEAVDIICRNEIDFSAVVLDISMPEMDGIEAMIAIKKSNPTLPVVLSSGYSEDDFSFTEDAETKPDGFLSKPFELSDMQSNLEKLLSGC